MQVGIILGSRSQWITMQHTAKLLAQLGIHYEARIINAKKISNKLHDYVSKSVDRGVEIIIAGSTGETYFPEIIASRIEVPVLGIQIDTSAKNENIYDPNTGNNTGNTIRMINAGPEGAVNAALFAASLLAKKYPRIRENLMKYQSQNERDKTYLENTRQTASS